MSKPTVRKKGSDLPYIFIDEVPDKQQKPFRKWLYGQTCPLIESQPKKSAAYYHDYKRWLAHFKKEEKAPVYD